MLTSCNRIRIVIACTCVTMLLLSMSACRNGPKGKDAAGADDESHGLHVVQNTRLSQIMDDLRALDFDRLARDAEHGSIDEDITRVAMMASSLADDARLIPVLFDELELSQEGRRVFDDLAARMARQCNELGTAARRKDLPTVREKVEEILTTCNACHASFRGPVVAMAAPRR